MIPLFIEETDTTLLTALEATLGTIPRYGLPIRNPITYASTPQIILNDPSDAADDTYEVDDVSIRPFWDETVEPHVDRDGSQSGEPRELHKIIQISGWVRGTSLAKLNDKIAALNRAFNPVLTRMDDNANDLDTGFVDLKFNVTTTDTANWASGYIAQEYHVRSIALPVPLTTKFDDYSARFRVVLRAVDPVRYEQTAQTATRTGSGDVTANNSKATYPSWPVIDLAFTTGASSDISIQRTNNPTYGRITKLAASGLTDSAGKTLRIDMRARSAEYTNGTDKTAALKADSRFFNMLHAGSNTISFTNLPADCAVTVTWYRAFA